MRKELLKRKNSENLFNFALVSSHKTKSLFKRNDNSRQLFKYKFSRFIFNLPFKLLFNATI